MIPKDEQFYDQLIGHLTRKGKVAEDAGQAVLVVKEFNDRALPPLRLHVTPETFGPHLRTTAEGAAASYPEIHPVEAAWRLFLVQLGEAIEGAGPGATELVLTDSGVVAQAP